MAIESFSRGDIPYPPGAIIFWHGNSENIPPGWEICDGNNGTPNLLDKFIKSVPDNTTDPGSTGGQNEFTLSEDQTPPHVHSGETTVDGDHTHDIATGGRMDEAAVGNSGSGDSGGSRHGESTVDGEHTHTYETDPMGESAPIDNQPAHVELLPIQKQ